MTAFPTKLALFLCAPLAALAVPAAAQDGAGDRVNMVIVYGEDACPAGEGDEIVVCARMDEGERYRIPETLRFSDNPANTAWARRVQSFETVGRSGTQSCSPTGGGGFTGCTQALIDAAYGERREGTDVRFGQLIEAARAERLATIDEDAAAEQARVEAIENEYMARLEAERQAEVDAETIDDTPLPTINPALRQPPAEPSPRLEDGTLGDPGFEDGGEVQRDVGPNATARGSGVAP